MAFFLIAATDWCVMAAHDLDDSTSRRPLRVALAGFGTVGRAVARILCNGSHGRLQLTHVCNRRVERKRASWVPAGVTWTDDIAAVLDSDADVVVELIGGRDPAADWIRRALEAGKSVVTANKQVIAEQGAELEALARRRGQRLRFEAAVAGGIPIIHGLQEGLAGDRLFRVLGILNGTCNYILTRMEADGVSFDAALREAQELGYAEADPAADVDGFDAQAKLAILAAVGLRCPVETGSIPLQTITTIESVDFTYAQRLACTIRQVSRAERDGDGRVLAAVQPMLVPRTSALAQVTGSRNVVVVEGAAGGETAFSGYGAGGDPTAVAVVSDLESIARGSGDAALRLAAGPAASAVQDFVSPHYARFTISDRPGVVAALAGVFSRHGVNIDAVLQEPGWSKAHLPFVMTLNACSAAAIHAALDEASAFDFHVRPPLWMPVLTQGQQT